MSRNHEGRGTEFDPGANGANGFLKHTYGGVDENRQSGGLGAHDVRWTSALRGPEWNGDHSPTSKIASGVHRCTACQFVKTIK